MATIKSLLSTTLESFLTSKNENIKQSAMPANLSSRITVTSQTNLTSPTYSYVAPCNGWFVADNVVTNAWCQVFNYGAGIVSDQRISGGVMRSYVPAKKGQNITVNAEGTVREFKLYFCPCNGL